MITSDRLISLVCCYCFPRNHKPYYCIHLPGVEEMKCPEAFIFCTNGSNCAGRGAAWMHTFIIFLLLYLFLIFLLIYFRHLLVHQRDTWPLVTLSSFWSKREKQERHSLFTRLFSSSWSFWFCDVWRTSLWTRKVMWCPCAWCDIHVQVMWCIHGFSVDCLSSIFWCHLHLCMFWFTATTILYSQLYCVHVLIFLNIYYYKIY